MAKQLRHILVAIRDLRHPSRSELRKAAAFAKASGATVELFHVSDEPDPGASYPETVTREAMERHRAAIIARNQRSLERLARDEALRGTEVGCTAAWHHPPSDAIARRAIATGADLVIAAAHGHRFGARLLLRNTDWELIRHCPVPLLLVKSRRVYQKPVVLACVDPFHAHAKPADLDTRLLDTAGQVAQLLHGATHIFHAYLPLVATQPASMSGPVLVLPPEVEEAHSQQIARAVDCMAERAGIARKRRHIHTGDVPGEICALAGRLRADLVVMGAVSRSALARLFIGNTAERVLDKLNCDVLVVKPAGFGAKEMQRLLEKGDRPRPKAAPKAASRREWDVKLPPPL